MKPAQLCNLRRKDAYWPNEGPEWLKHVFQRQESFNWFCKNNRDRLIRDGAMVKLGRDFFIDRETFPTVAERILGVQAE